MPTIEELQNLLKDEVSPDAVLAGVTEKPLVNGFEEKFKHVAAFINLVPSPGRENCFRALRKDDRVIYWKTAENEVGVEIVGIVWDEKGEAQIFCGTILPP